MRKLTHKNRSLLLKENKNVKKEQKTFSTFFRLLTYTKQEKNKFFFAIFSLIFIVLFDLIQPIVIGLIYNLLDKKVSEDVNFHLIILLVIVLLVIIIISAVLQYIQIMILQKAGQRIIYNIREETFEKIESLSIGQINNIPVGKLVTRVTSDTNAINEMYTNTLINLLRNGLTIIGVVIAMFLVNVRLTLYVLAITPLIIVASFLFRHFSRKAHRDVRKNISNVNASLSENISGIKLTQTFNQEEKQYAEFLEKNNALKQSQLKQMSVFSIFRPSIYVIYLSTVIFVIYMGCVHLLNLDVALSAGTFIIFYQYIDKFYNPIQQLADQFNMLQSSLAASERIFEILDTKCSVVDRQDAIEMPHLLGDIEFKNVWFAYNEGEWILKDVSFKINHHETVAFVGSTGSGKTTILSLIVRNYDIQKGQILIDGKDIKTYKIASLRKNIGQMLQDVFLFSGTIRNNITLRDSSITEEEIADACKFVNADKVIQKLPEGLETKILERGNNFSSGERQLLSFARVIANRPNIMILDEATSNIDTETESLIQDSLSKMMKIGTMLIVAHRLSTIQHANKIIVLRKGKIIEEGNHQELLKLGGYYYQLYTLQYQKKQNS